LHGVAGRSEGDEEHPAFVTRDARAAKGDVGYLEFDSFRHEQELRVEC
jgi:hypothetical protein